MQFTNCTTRDPLFHDLYGLHESYKSCQAIYGSYLFDSIGQGCKMFILVSQNWTVNTKTNHFVKVIKIKHASIGIKMFTSS